MYQYARDFDQELISARLLDDIEEYLRESPIESAERMTQRARITKDIQQNRGKVFTQ